jgi:signal transduction histidine kinase
MGHILPVSVVVISLSQIEKRKVVVRYANMHAKQEFGFDPEKESREFLVALNELLKHTDCQISRETYETILSQAHEGPLVFHPVQNKASTPSSRKSLTSALFFDIYISPFTWDDDEECLVVTLNNITESVLNQKLREVDEFKDNLMSSVSHNLRTPMNGVISSIEMTALSTFEPKEVQKYMELARTHAAYMMDMINDLIDFSMSNRGMLHPRTRSFLMIDLLKDIQKANTVISEGKKSVKLMVSTGENVPSIINTDYERLKRILMNLVGNALKFTFAGEVKLSVEALTAETKSFGLELKTLE